MRVEWNGSVIVWFLLLLTALNFTPLRFYSSSYLILISFKHGWKCGISLIHDTRAFSLNSFIILMSLGSPERNSTPWFYYRPQPSCGQGNIFTPVCHSFCSQGEGLPQCMLGYHPPPGPGRPPRDQADTTTPRTRQTPQPPRTRQTSPKTRQTPPGEDTLLDQADPPPGSRLQHMVYEQPVRILLECILVLLNYYK